MSGLGSRSQKPGNAKSTVGSDEREPGPQKIWDRKSRRVSGSLENGTRRERNPKGAESEGSGTRRERNPKGVEPEGSGTRREWNPKGAELDTLNKLVRNSVSRQLTDQSLKIIINAPVKICFSLCLI
jgi:hypothetical protein